MLHTTLKQLPTGNAHLNELFDTRSSTVTNTQSINFPPLSPEEWKQFPKSLSTALGWIGSDFETSKDEIPKYVIELSESESNAIIQEISNFKRLNVPIAQITPSNFALPASLKSKLNLISSAVHTGRGFAVLRGLDPKKMSSEDDTIAFTAITTYIGDERYTSPFGMSLNHVRSAVNDRKPTNAPATAELNASKLPEKMKFHADRFFGDILVLHNRRLGNPNSGAQYLASFETIYNILQKTSRETLRILAGEWTWPSIMNPTATPATGPVIFAPNAEGRIIAQLIYTPFKDPKSLSALQRGALDVVNAVAHSVSVRLDRKEGDILFFNNLGLLHARDAFAADDNRHILRIAMRNSKLMWTKPAGFEEKFEDGYGVDLAEQKIPVDDWDAWVSTTAGEANHG